jgi:hypothetical protein
VYEELPFSGMWSHVRPERTDVSEERIASILWVEKICEGRKVLEFG